MSATFILSTGRCGTQWLAKNLAETLPEDWRVEHEPLHFDYAPLKNSPSHPLVCNAEKLTAHLSGIQKHVGQDGHYIECGFPCWRHLQWFREALDCPVKIIHLHRHPVAVARSWLKQNAFVPPILPHLPVKELFHPAAVEALLPEYLKAWDHLTSFEKNLYYWAEVQLQALSYKKIWNDSPWLELPFARLNDQKLLEYLEVFLAAPLRADYWRWRKTDDYQGLEQAPVDESLLEKHPDVRRVMAAFNYPS